MTAMKLTDFERRADAYGRELAAALVLASERSGLQHQMMRDMTAVAAREMRKSIDWLRVSGLPEGLVRDYERACRDGFRAELHGAVERWRMGEHATTRQAA